MFKILKEVIGGLVYFIAYTIMFTIFPFPILSLIMTGCVSLFYMLIYNSQPSEQIILNWIIILWISMLITWTPIMIYYIKKRDAFWMQEI